LTQRIVVVTEEPLTERLAGPAIRALELSRALAGSGECAVDLVSLTGCVRVDDLVALRLAGEPELRGLVRRADAVLVQGDVLASRPVALLASNSENQTRLAVSIHRRRHPFEETGVAFKAARDDCFIEMR